MLFGYLDSAFVLTAQPICSGPSDDFVVLRRRQVHEGRRVTGDAYLEVAIFLRFLLGGEQSLLIDDIELDVPQGLSLQKLQTTSIGRRMPSSPAMKFLNRDPSR